MTHYEYYTENTCSRVIRLDLDGDVVHNVSFLGGCDGNLKAIPILVEGMTVGGDRGEALRRPVRTARHLLQRPAGAGGSCGVRGAERKQYRRIKGDQP